MTPDPTPSDAEAARIVQETADVLCDDLGWPFYSIHRPIVRRAIADAVERWRIYARGGEAQDIKTARVDAMTDAERARLDALAREVFTDLHVECGVSLGRVKANRARAIILAALASRAPEPPQAQEPRDLAQDAFFAGAVSDRTKLVHVAFEEWWPPTSTPMPALCDIGSCDKCERDAVYIAHGVALCEEHGPVQVVASPPPAGAQEPQRAFCPHCEIEVTVFPGRSAPAPDVICEHGTAMDVHCCNCHSGFLFDGMTCVCELEAPAGAAGLREQTRLSERLREASGMAEVIHRFPNTEGDWGEVATLFAEAADALAASPSSEGGLEQWQQTVAFHRDMAARFAESRDELKHRCRTLERELGELRAALEQIARFLQRAGGVHVRSYTNEWICRCDMCSIVKSALASTPAAAPTEVKP